MPKTKMKRKSPGIARDAAELRLDIRPIGRDSFPDIERLFGTNGACGGCWCMSWRQEKGEPWEDVKGSVAKARFAALVRSGRAHGLLAFVGGEPVAWCSVDRRVDFKKLDRAPSLACDDAERVWSIPCFFIRRDFRNKGVGTALLAAALKLVKAEGGAIAEGYPTKPYGKGGPIPAAFAWTGTVPMFEKAGFRLEGDRSHAKLRMRRRV